MYRKITNPLTGKKVLVTGKLGKQIIGNYMKFLYGGETKGLEKLQTNLRIAQKGVYNLNNKLLKEKALVNKLQLEINRIKTGGANARDGPKEIIKKKKN